MCYKSMFVNYKKFLSLFLVILLLINLFSSSVYSVPTGMICASDLNKDGDIQENEYAKCEIIYTCPDPNGSACDANHQCVITSEPNCPLGNFSCNNGVCKEVGVCQSSQVQIEKYQCPTTGQVYSDLNTCNNNCIQIASCNKDYTCPPGFILVGYSTKCIADPTVVYSCPSCSTVLSQQQKCTGVEYSCECEGPTRTSSSCVYVITIRNVIGGASWTYTVTLVPNVSYICPYGSYYNPSTGKCETSPSINYICPLGNYPCSGFPPTCRKGEVCVTYLETVTKWKCSLNGQLYETKSQCTSSCYRTANCNCPSGYSYTSGDVCKKVMSCNSSWNCPLPGGSECIYIDMKDSYENEAKFKDEGGELKYYDDNAWQDDGSCGGQIIFFNGQPQECLTSGIKTGFHNCCNECDSKIKNDLEDAMRMYKGLKAVSGIWKTVTIAYRAARAYSYLSSLGEAASLVDSASLASQFKLSETAATAVMHAGSMEGAMQGAIQATYFSAPAIWTTVGWFAASLILEQGLKIFFGGCNATSVLTACYKEMGLCHYVGKRCVKKWPLVGCVQKAKVYCCYNSKLARIINEAARQQLKTLQGWGSARFPVCRGLYPEEFQMLDFSRIDLSEWYEDIKTRTMENIQQKMEENVEKFKQEYQQPGTD